MGESTIHPRVRIGHVRLKVADLEGPLREARQPIAATAPGTGPRDLG
jgi:hypothetical protein